MKAKRKNIHYFLLFKLLQFVKLCLLINVTPLGFCQKRRYIKKTNTTQRTEELFFICSGSIPRQSVHLFLFVLCVVVSSLRVECKKIYSVLKLLVDVVVEFYCMCISVGFLECFILQFHIESSLLCIEYVGLEIFVVVVVDLCGGAGIFQNVR